MLLTMDMYQPPCQQAHEPQLLPLQQQQQQQQQQQTMGLRDVQPHMEEHLAECAAQWLEQAQLLGLLEGETKLTVQVRKATLFTHRCCLSPSKAHRPQPASLPRGSARGDHGHETQQVHDAPHWHACPWSPLAVPLGSDAGCL